jgi:hypothetical protein
MAKSVAADDDSPWRNHFELRQSRGRSVLLDKATGQRAVFATLEDAKRFAIKRADRLVRRQLGVSRRPLDGLDVDLAAQFALYETHRFCIRLPPEASLLEEDGTPRREFDADTLGFFVHEYTHFRHNVSTVAGWVAYELMLQLLSVFTHALDDTGRCDADRLDDQQRADASAAARALYLVEGARGLPPRPSPAVKLHVLSIASRTEEIRGVPFAVRDVHWEITRRDGTVEEVDLPVGAILIEEGLAYLLETAVRWGKLTFDDGWTLVGGAPLFPYLAFQVLCRARAPSISPLAALRAGLLALNFNRPGDALIRTLDYYRTLRDQGCDDDTACARMRATIAPSLAEISARVREEGVAGLARLFEGRGLLYDGSKQVQQWFAEGLAAREADIWFDLAWCSGPNVDPDALSVMLRTTTPCDVIQERFGDPRATARDALISFSEKRKDPHDRTLSGVRTLQAQLDFLIGHLTTSGVVSTLPSGHRRCPYFSVCILDMRRDDPDTCERRPSALWNRDPTCWYGAAVAGSLGKVARVDDVEGVA